MITLTQHSVDFMAAYGVPSEFYFDLNELIDLSSAVASLGYATEESLLMAYKESFRTRNESTYLTHWPLMGHRIFGTIQPKYRNKPPLKYNLNDTQIVLALCFKESGTNGVLPSRPYMAFRACSFDQGYEGLRYVSLKLLPVALTQSRFGLSHILSHVLFGGSHYYHPAQRVMLPPLWITGCSYADSVKQPQSIGPHNNTANDPSQSPSNNIHQLQTNLAAMAINVYPQQTPPPPTVQQPPQTLYIPSAAQQQQQHQQNIMGTMMHMTIPPQHHSIMTGGALSNFVSGSHPLYG